MARVWVAFALAAFLPSAAAQPAAITVYASVTDKAGHFVADLTSADFILKDDGQVRPIGTAAIDPSPISLVLLLDRSGSMGLQLPQVGALASGVIDGLRNGDRLRMGQLDPRPLTLNPADFSGDRAALQRALMSLPTPDKATALWNAVDASVTAFDRISGYRAVLVVSDGHDTASMLARSDVVTHAQKSGVIVHGIELPPPALVARYQSAAPELKPLADNVGGGYWRLSPGGDVRAFIGGVNEGLRARYAITFVPRSADGKMHKLDLSTVRRDVAVRLAKKYLATGGPK